MDDLPEKEVETSIYIQAINNIDQNDFSYEMTMNFRWDLGLTRASYVQNYIEAVL